ncbi:MAG: hypothetical protein VB093_15130 [Propionicimonas sp.]|nr:hypothetical protein [Propionicimonas sp.]MEA5117308.1 hypothetical protein [Propionicimonas sp.]
MTVEVEVDGSLFSFPEGWEVEKLDEWPEQARLSTLPFEAKSCDLVAMKAGVLWLVEAKDYTYPGAKLPGDLAQTVGSKIFDSMAVLHAVARWGSGTNQAFSRRALQCHDARICLAVQLPDGGRRLIGVQTPLANIKADLTTVTRRLGVLRPVVSSFYQPDSVPWQLRRDPRTRGQHADR